MNPISSPYPSPNPSQNNALPGAGKIRAIGWLLIVIGPCLSGAMAVAIYSLQTTTFFDRFRGNRPQWHGSPAFTRSAYELFGAVFLLGLVVFIGGIYQVRTGRRNPVLVAFALLLWGVAGCLTYVIATAP